jgi:hypothetical protein
MQRVTSDTPRPIREQASHVPVWLDEFILQLLEKDRSVRFGSAREVAEILQIELAQLQNPAFGVEPVRSWRRQALSQSKRKTITAVSGALVLLIGAVLYGTWNEIPIGQQARNDPKSSRSASDDSLVDRNDKSDFVPTIALPPLWGADGTYELKAAVDKMRANQFASSDMSDAESIQAATIKSIHQRIAQLWQELVPGPADQIDQSSSQFSPSNE